MKCGHTSKQADNLCLLDSSLRERELLTSNARPWTRLALSRRNSTFELSANYLLMKFRKTDHRFGFLDPDYL
jgi:hypothetical protein